MKLILLGIWDTTPGDSWHWFTQRMTDYFKALTGFGIRHFVIRERGLNKELLSQSDTEQLRKYFIALSEKEKSAFVRHLVDDYYIQFQKAQNFIADLEKRDPSKLDDKQIIQTLKRWSEILPRITFQIWFAVIVDLWYPDSKAYRGFKRQLGRARDDSGKLHHRIYSYAWKLYRIFARRFRIPLKHFMNAMIPELIAMIEGRQRISKQECINRTRLSVLTHRHGQDIMLTGKNASKFMATSRFVNQTPCMNSGLKGIPACPGKAKGLVRKIFFNKDFSLFRQGEILVTYQTMVHFLPLIKKAGAVLTEFGGLTTHAAVVSRELGKPCVVGIKGLTAALKNGDRVEVDATKGEVKRI